MHVVSCAKSAYPLFVSDRNQNWDVSKNFTKNLQCVHKNPPGSSSVIPCARTWPRWESLLTLHDRAMGGIWTVHFGVGASSLSAGTQNPNRVQWSWIYCGPLRCYKVWLHHPVRCGYGATGILCQTNGLLQQHFCKLVRSERDEPRFDWYVGSLGLDHFIHFDIKELIGLFFGLQWSVFGR